MLLRGEDGRELRERAPRICLDAWRRAIVRRSDAKRRLRAFPLTPELQLQIGRPLLRHAQRQRFISQPGAENDPAVLTELANNADLHNEEGDAFDDNNALLHVSAQRSPLRPQHVHGGLAPDA